VIDAGTPGGGAAGGAADAGLSGDRCEAAQSLGVLVSLASTTIGFANDYGVSSGNAGCGLGYAGPDRAFSFVVPPGSRLMFEVLPDFSFDPVVMVFTGAPAACAGACALQVDRGVDGEREVGSWVNATGSSVTAFLVIGGNNPAPAGAFTLNATVAPVPLGERCTNPVPISGNTTLTGLSLAPFVDDYATCTLSNTGADEVFSLSVGAGERLVVSAGGPLFPAISLSTTACTASLLGACVGSRYPSSVSTPQVRAEYVNHTNAPTPLFAVFDALANTGTSTVQFAFDQPPAGDWCGSAEPLVANTSVGNQSTSAFSNDFVADAGGCVANTSGRDRMYSISVPSLHRLSVTASPSGGFNPRLFLSTSLAGCLAGVCSRSSDTGGANQPESLEWTNTAPLTSTAFIIVDAVGDETGTFGLSVAVTPPVTGDRCELPAALVTDGGLTSGSTVGITNDYTGTGVGCSAAAGGPDAVQLLTVPPSTRANVIVLPDAGFDPSLSIVPLPASNCDQRTCVASVNAAPASGIETLAVTNKDATQPRSYFVVVDSAAAPGQFDVSVALSPVTVAPQDTCATAGGPFTATTVVPGLTTTGFDNDYGPGLNCGPSAGPDRITEVQLPAGKQLTATVSPGVGFDANLALVLGPPSQCEVVPRFCAAWADARGAGLSEVARYTNRSASVVPVFVVVGAASAASSGGYTLFLDVVDAPIVPQGDVCALAVPTTAGTLSNQTTNGSANDYQPATACTGRAESGLDRVYAVTVAAGQTLTATVTPAGASDPGVYLVRGPETACAATPLCLAGADGFSSDSVSYTNASGAPELIYIVVDSSQAGAVTFDLTVALSP
jgi:hypothetical protein